MKTNSSTIMAITAWFVALWRVCRGVLSLFELTKSLLYNMNITCS